MGKLHAVSAMILVVLPLLLAGCISAPTQPVVPAPQPPKVINPGLISAPTASSVIGDNMDVSAGNGDTVAVDYVGTLENGSVFDTSLADVARKAGLPLRSSYEPLAFVVGAGQMIKGFDAGVVGMKAGEEKNVTLKPEDAYGPVNPVYLVTFPTDKLEEELGAKPEPGMQLNTNQGLTGVVISVILNETKVDFNPPLAGKTLVFRIIMKRIDKKG